MNNIFTATMAVHIPKYIYGQYLCAESNACTTKRKVCYVGLEKNTVFITTMYVHIPKPLYQMEFSSLLDNQLV